MLLAGRESLSKVLMHGGRPPITHVYACVRVSVVVELNGQVHVNFILCVCVCVNISIQDGAQVLIKRKKKTIWFDRHTSRTVEVVRLLMRSTISGCVCALVRARRSIHVRRYL